MSKTKRIAALFRELAEAFDDLEEPAKRAAPKLARESLKRASDDAVRRVRDGLRKQGIRVS